MGNHRTTWSSIFFMAGVMREGAKFGQYTKKDIPLANRCYLYQETIGQRRRRA